MRSHLLVLLVFILLTLGMTYPLAFNTTNSIPESSGDPLLNTWILAWDIYKITTNPRGFWDANIFYPHHNTLAYSEHLFASALLALPIMIISKNPILAYNFVFLSSFALSGFGMYLLVYYLARNRWAGLIAGITFAFTPYRFSHLGHLQLLTTQWLPFTFLYLHKLFEETNYKNLALLNLFFILQVLSCGYYALYLTLFGSLFIFYSMVIHKCFLNKNLWLKLGLFALVSSIVCFPLFYPYIEVKNQMGLIRSLEENISWSPDILNYLVASSKFWKPLSLIFKDYWKGEATLFPGLIPIILAFFAIVIPLNKAISSYKRQYISPWKRFLIRLINISTISLITVCILIILTGGFSFAILGFKVTCHHLQNPIIFLFSFQSIRLLVDFNVKKKLKYAWTSTSPISRGYFLVTILAFFFSLGPIIHLAKAELFYGPYYLLYQFFPGFDGLRVPARLAIMVVFGLSVLAGIGATKLLASISFKSGRFLVIFFLSLFALVESFPGPINTPKLLVGRDIPRVYQWLARQKEEFAMIELPRPHEWSNTVSMTYNSLSMYYSTYHWKKLVNGYSGFFPKLYPSIFFVMRNFPSDTSLNILEDLGVKYVILHSQEYTKDEWEKVLKKIAQYTDRLRFVENFSPDMVYEVINYKRNIEEKKIAAKNLLKIPRHSWRAYSNPIGNASSAIDGDIATRWSTDRYQKPGDSFVLDLGKSYKLTKLVIYLGNSWTDFPRRYKLEVSTNGNTWNVVNPEIEGVVPLIKGIVEDGKSLYLAIDFLPVIGRYLKMTQTGFDQVYYWSIHELEVFTSRE